MASTLGERLTRLGVLVAPWLGWMIGNLSPLTYRNAFDNHTDFRNAVLGDPEAQAWSLAELNEALAQSLPTEPID